MKKLLFAAALLVAACAHTEPAPVPPADVLYREAMAEAEPRNFLWWETDDCEDAIPLFQQVIDNYTPSRYATLSELGIADCYFRQEQWSDAIFHYREFEDRHPTHEEIYKVRYRLAESYHELSLDYDLDTADLEHAYYYYGKAAEMDSPYRAQAAQKARREAEQLAQRIFYVGRFYERNGEVLSAIDRYTDLIRAFPNLPRAHDAYERAAKLLREIGEPEKVAALPKPAGAK